MNKVEKVMETSGLVSDDIHTYIKIDIEWPRDEHRMLLTKVATENQLFKYE